MPTLKIKHSTFLERDFTTTLNNSEIKEKNRVQTVTFVLRLLLIFEYVTVTKPHNIYFV